MVNKVITQPARMLILQIVDSPVLELVIDEIVHLYCDFLSLLAWISSFKSWTWSMPGHFFGLLRDFLANEFY